MGFIIGLLTGAVVALLYAPKTGDLTREELRVRSEELKRRADDLQRIAQKLADDASVKGRELIDEARKQWDSSAAGRAATGPAAGPKTTSGGSTKQD
jgi:gas vesicle protein